MTRGTIERGPRSVVGRRRSDRGIGRVDLDDLPSGRQQPRRTQRWPTN